VVAHRLQQVTIAPTLTAQYSSGICSDSPTTFFAAKWITCSIGCSVKTRSSRARSRTSPS
jgi:hypothetical protein